MDNLIEGKKQSWDSMFYSIQRIDLLIISICGAGVYTCLETTKFVLSATNKCTCCITPSIVLIKIAALSFLVGIILNFLSQQFGYIANRECYLMHLAEIELKQIKEDNPDPKFVLQKIKKLEEESKKYDTKSDNYSNLTTTMNYASMGFMFLGLILTFLFFAITF